MPQVTGPRRQAPVQGLLRVPARRLAARPQRPSSLSPSLPHPDPVVPLRALASCLIRATCLVQCCRTSSTRSTSRRESSGGTTRSTAPCGGAATSKPTTSYGRLRCRRTSVRSLRRAAPWSAPRRTPLSHVRLFVNRSDTFAALAPLLAAPVAGPRQDRLIPRLRRAFKTYGLPPGFD